MAAIHVHQAKDSYQDVSCSCQTKRTAHTDRFFFHINGRP